MNLWIFRLSQRLLCRYEPHWLALLLALLCYSLFFLAMHRYFPYAVLEEPSAAISPLPAECLPTVE